MPPPTSAVKCTLDDLLVCYPTHANNIDHGGSWGASGSGQEYSQASHQNALALINSSHDYKNTKQTDIPASKERNWSSDSGSHGRNIDPSLLLQAYHQQSPGNSRTMSGGGDSNQKTEFQVPLEKVMVQVHYQDLKQGSVVDNDYYTTLLPSKLPPSAWGAQATFAPTTLPGSSSSGPRGVNYLDILTPQAVSPLFATSLRRLLALYVCGKSAR
jgi:hypothetical protein